MNGNIVTITNMSSEKDQYDSFAGNYSHFQKQENNHAREAFYGTMDFSLEGKVILDAGCGDGQDILYYQSQGATTYGFDSSKEMVVIAQNMSPKSEIIHSSFEKTPYENDFFDCILSKYAIQHQKNLEVVFSEFHRILKGNGTLYILITHPLTHFLHSKDRNYFIQNEVCLPLFDEKVTVCEPSHQLEEYFSSTILKKFRLLFVKEGEDPAIKNMIKDSHYPGFLILKMEKI